VKRAPSSSDAASRERDQTAAPPEPEPTTPAEDLLALQRAAGNAAVGRLLGAQRGLHRAPPQHGGTAAPARPVDVTSLGAKIIPGGEGRTGGKPDVRPMGANTTKVFKGDTVTFTAGFDGAAADGGAGFSVGTNGDGAVQGAGKWIGDRTYQWSVVFTKVGHKQVSVQGAGSTFTENFEVVADIVDFIAACVEAQSKVLERFAAASEKLGTIGVEYNKAFAQQEGDLKEVAESEKMVDDLIWGAFFAAVGGAAGGAVGGWIKRTKDGLYKNDDFLIDTGKDLMKFTVRSVDKLRGGSGPRTSGDSTAPGDPGDPGKGRGERKAAGKDPFEYVSGLSVTVGAEGRKAHGKLGELIHGAREARDANSKADFEDDPVAIVGGGVDLKEIDAITADKKTFLKQLWKAWLGRYAYKMEYGGGGGPPAARDQVTKKVRKKIKKAADECGEDVDAWIAEFGLPARLKAEQEAADAPWDPPDYSWP
jgi:hypothetical protein